MSESVRDAAIKKFAVGIKHIEDGKISDGLRDLRVALLTLWEFEDDEDALAIDLTLFSVENRLEKLKDNTKFVKTFLEALKQTKEALEKRDEKTIYANIKKILSNVMELVPIAD